MPPSDAAAVAAAVRRVDPKTAEQVQRAQRSAACPFLPVPLLAALRWYRAVRGALHACCGSRALPMKEEATGQKWQRFLLTML